MSARVQHALTGRRRTVVAASLLGWLVLFASTVCAQEVSVPAAVQVALLAKLAAYDKNYATRAGQRARVMIVVMKGDGDSLRMSGQLLAALSETERIGGLLHDESVVEYTDASSIAKECQDQHAAIVYLTPGLTHEIESIGRALAGATVLSVGSVNGYASRGTVIDFFVEGGKPKIALNLTQARKQQVAFAPELVRIMRVLE